jgi:NADPH2:quinone reductase
MRAIRVRAPGGPAVLELVELALPEPGPGEARVRLEAIGVNFIDVYHRSGLYPQPLPFTPGSEGAGVVTALAPDVTEVAVGQRVAWAMQLGSYAEEAVVPAWKLVPLPAGVPATTGAAAMLQGMTAHYLTRSTFALGPGHTALVHAAAGGVGLLLVQLAKRAGARVIGTVGSATKVPLVRAAGADHVVLYRETDFVAEARRLTGGLGVDVVYDSVGKDTFARGLDALRRRGMMVLFGQSSGPVPPFDLARLNAAGSLYVTRPSLSHYAADRAEVLLRGGEVLGAIARGELMAHVERTFPLAQAAQAHRALESRATAGKLLLLP